MCVSVWARALLADPAWRGTDAGFSVGVLITLLFLDATLTFNAAAPTRRQMQLSNAAALPLCLRSCLSMAFNSKKQLQRGSHYITDAIVPHSCLDVWSGNWARPAIVFRTSGYELFQYIFTFSTATSCSIYPRNLTPQNLIILSWIWRSTGWGFMRQLIKTDGKTRSGPHAE